MDEMNLEKMLVSLNGIDLTDEERNTLKWLSGWETSTVDNLVNIIKKCRDN